jgi:hypothetical protein
MIPIIITNCLFLVHTLEKSPKKSWEWEYNNKWNIYKKINSIEFCFDFPVQFLYQSLIVRRCWLFVCIIVWGFCWILLTGHALLKGITGVVVRHMILLITWRSSQSNLMVHKFAIKTMNTSVTKLNRYGTLLDVESATTVGDPLLK